MSARHPACRLPPQRPVLLAIHLDIDAAKESGQWSKQRRDNGKRTATDRTHITVDVAKSNLLRVDLLRFFSL